MGNQEHLSIFAPSDLLDDVEVLLDLEVTQALSLSARSAHRSGTRPSFRSLFPEKEPSKTSEQEPQSSAVVPKLCMLVLQSQNFTKLVY